MTKTQKMQQLRDLKGFGPKSEEILAKVNNTNFIKYLVNQRLTRAFSSRRLNAVILDVFQIRATKKYKLWMASSMSLKNINTASQDFDVE